MNAAHQAPVTIEFSRQQYCSGLPCSPPGDLLNPGIEPRSLLSPAWVSGFFTTTITLKVQKPTKLEIYKGYFPGDPVIKNSSCNAGDPSFIPGSGRFPGERIGYPLQYS